MPTNHLRFRDFVVPMRQLPRRTITHKSLYKSSMHRMSSALGHHLALDAPSSQRKIANQIEHFVPHKLIRKPKRPIFNTLPRQNDRAIVRNPANQTHIPQHRLIFLKPKRPRRSNLTHIIAGREVARKCLYTNGLREVDRVLDAVPLPRIHPDKLRPFAYLNLFNNLQILTLPPLLTQANLMKSPDIRHRRPIQNWYLKVIHLDDHVIHAEADKGTQEMFGRRNEYALAHQAGCVAHLGYIAADGGDLKVV